MSLLCLIVRWGQIANFWKKPSSLFIKESELQATSPLYHFIRRVPLSVGHTFSWAQELTGSPENINVDLIQAP